MISIGANNTGLQKKYFSAWKVHKKADPEEAEEATDSSKVEKPSIQDSQSADPPQVIDVCTSLPCVSHMTVHTHCVMIM